MKGKNTLTLNEATMMEAVQFWLNSQMAIGKAPAVTGVSTVKDYGTTVLFSIEIETVEN